MHIHQALVGLMAVNMFPFCDKSGYRRIYAAVGREPNRTGPVRQRSHSAYVKIKTRLNRAGVERKFIVVSRSGSRSQTAIVIVAASSACVSRIAPAFNNGESHSCQTCVLIPRMSAGKF